MLVAFGIRFADGVTVKSESGQMMKLVNLSQGWSEGSLFNSYYTEV